MQIALAQINPVIGDFEYNAGKIISFLARAREKGASLAVFPELSITGYPPKDLLLRSDFIKQVQEVIEQRLLPASRELPMLIGSPQRDPLDQHILYNAALLLAEGKVAGRQDKSLLPNYDVFDESRYFTPAHERRPMAFQGVQLGVTICEDIWNDKDFWNRRLYPLDPVEELYGQGARVIINLSASPYFFHKLALRNEMLGSIAAKYGMPVIYVNQAGGNDDLIFDGESMVFNSKGRCVACLSAFKEDLQIIDLNALEKNDPPAGETPQESIKWVHDALVAGIRDYLFKTGFQRVIIGLSGGIDSAVTAALAASALGPENVLGVAMPSRYSSQGSIDDAERLAANLRIPFRTIAIEEAFRSYLSLFNPPGEVVGDLAEENIQARIRGNILMFLSNREGCLVLTTGNKSEMAVGYCTLYGDMSGGLAVLADVPKVMVYELARYINREREVIPASVLEKPPSAELRPDQRDEDSLPPYAVLDSILKLYIEESRPVEEIAALGFNGELVRKVAGMVDSAEYKRRQAAPGLKVTTKAFGPGRRMPIAQRTRHR